MLEFIFLAILILFAILLVPYIFKRYDKYTVIAPPDYNPYYSTHTNFPFWNTQYESKRNMSYDLRGDVQIPYVMWTPFNMPSTIPIQNKPLYLVS